MKKLFIAFCSVSLVLLSGCGERNKEVVPLQKQSTGTDSLTLIGQTLHIDYGNMQAVVTYGQDALVWQTSSPQGELSAHTKEISHYEVLGNGRIMVTWQEATGEVVAQIVDLSARQVKAFIYPPLSEERMNRAAIQLTGKITQ